VALLMAILLMTGWGYTLTDQAEPDVLALRTQQGTYRITRGSDFACEFLEANQNVYITDGNKLAPAVQDGWSPVCEISVISQVDANPCMTNKQGDCDVKAENESD